MSRPCALWRPPRGRISGFTWIELLAVVTVVGILALMAIPAMQDSALKRQVKEGMALADVAKPGVQAFWSATGQMPADNVAAGIPPSNKIVGALVKGVNVDAGAVTLTFGNNAAKPLADKKLTLRPAVVPGQPVVPIAWICAKVPAPKEMELRGRDETDIQPSWLPIECRGKSS